MNDLIEEFFFSIVSAGAAKKVACRSHLKDILTDDHMIHSFFKSHLNFFVANVSTFTSVGGSSIVRGCVWIIKC